MQPAPALPTRVRHLILDRDGVLNVEAPDHGYILRPEDFRWLPGSLAALASLGAQGLHVSVATNQSAVGRGLMTLAQLERVLAAMREQAAAAGARISAVYFCPHAPEAHCECRKPAPGLLRAAIAASGIAAAETLVVGDDVRDVQAARAAGVAAALVRTGKGAHAAARLLEQGEPVPTYADLAAVAHALSATPPTPANPGPVTA